MHFEIIADITEIESIAIGTGIRILPLLRKRYGRGRWRKLKGKTMVRLEDGTIRRAEVHWSKHMELGRRKHESNDSWIDVYANPPKTEATVSDLYSQ